MNILLVDDQKAIVESLKKGIRWDRLPVEQVYTACSAKEAKLVLMNFEVDVLVSDIEMPEEDGLSLCTWAKDKFPDMECIFLTSHAEFEYAKKALKMGSFDYILQPVRYEEVEQALMKVWQRIRQNRRMLQVIDSQRRVIMQRNTILDAMMFKVSQEKYEDADQIFLHFREMFQPEYEECAVCPILVQVLKWKKITNVWDEELVRLVLCNVLEELFDEFQGKAVISNLMEERYWIFLVLERKGAAEDIVREKLAFYSDHSPSVERIWL